MTDKKVIKDFVEMMDRLEGSGLRWSFNETHEYKALKALLDKPDCDGWIEWRKPNVPNLPIETRLELKFFNGDIEKGFVGENWIWRNIIAYRIIPEPKEEKKEPKKQTLLSCC